MNQKSSLREKPQSVSQALTADSQTILIEREKIKRQTIASRRLHHRAQAA
jgi:hypothetical protein